MSRPSMILASAVLLAGCTQGGVPAAPLAEGGFDLEALAPTFEQPLFLTHAGDGSGRLYVAEQAGAVKVIEHGTSSAYLDIRDRVQLGGERGLLGLAFHPSFSSNGRLFVHYSDRNGDTVLSEFHGNVERADPGSERVLLQVDQPYPNHNGGMLAFGPDGKLYLGLGDGGSANDPDDRAQNLGVLLGKILRLDVDTAPAPTPYTIPPDNPYATRTQGAEIWDYGLRNPWRFSFDRKAGDLWIGDVGQSDYEEGDHEGASSHGGVNYGWSRYEGNHIRVADREAPGAVGPVGEYGHAGTHCSITGGYVYRGPAIPSLQGAYLFGDYCSGVLWTLRPDGHGGYAMAQVMDTDHNISSFGEDGDGELYVVDHAGQVLKVVTA